MRLTVLADQISRDPDTACEQITSWGARDLELRSVGTLPIGADLSAGFLEDLTGILARWDVRVAAIAPQAFKVGLTDQALRYHRRILLPASLHLALLLGSPYVYIGAPKRPPGAGPCPDDVLEVLAEAAELAGTLGVLLALENEAGSWAERAAELGHIAGAVGHHAFQICWDPAVSAMAGEDPFPGGLTAVRSRLASLRIRDVSGSPGAYRGALPGDGICKLAPMVQSLAQSGYRGSLSLDPRLSPRLEGARAAFESAQRMISAGLRRA